MKIIISPAKKMNVDTDTFAPLGLPVFLSRTKELMDYMKGLSYEGAKKLWSCNDKIAAQNFERYAQMDLERGLTPAILSYEGIQYQYMSPMVFSETALDYVQKNLRILSGFYGIVRPFDGVTPYRLEMQAKASIGGFKDLYEYWGDSLYQELTSDGDRLILNLASKEYSKCIEKYLGENDLFVTCVFGEEIDGKIVQKGTLAKMARGEMVRFLAENEIDSLEGVKNFHGLGYEFSKELSGEKEYIFIKKASFKRV